MKKKKEAGQTDLEALELLGPVHRVKQLNYSVTRVKGEIIKGALVDEDHENVNCLKTFYENGSIQEDRCYFLHDGSSFSRTYKDGLEYEMLGYSKEGRITHRSRKEYNENCKVHSVSTIGANDIILAQTIWNYDDKNNPIEVNSYDPPGVLIEYRHFKFDERGFEIEQKGFKADGTFILWVQHENNDRGHAIKDIRLNEDGSVINVENRIWGYDNEGTIISLNGHSTRGFLPTPSTGNTFEYEYDERGNWIKKIVICKGIAVNILTREIDYYGEEATIIDTIMIDKKDETPAPEVKEEVAEIPQSTQKGIPSLDGKQLMWLADGSADMTDFSALRYYVLMNNAYPSVTTHSEDNIEVVSLLEELKNDMDAEVVHAAYDTDWGNGLKMESYTVSFPNNEGYLLQVSDINEDDEDNYDVPSHIETDDYGRVHTGTVMVLHPSDLSGERDQDFEDEIENLINFCQLENLPQKPMIYMIQMSGPNWYLRHHAVDDSFEIKDLDLNYGEGFSKFNDELMQRFRTETKGLVLFHGEPGTGKTYYIRHLLRSMVANKKIVIYMPPNMVDHMVEPGFMTFISQTVDSYTRSGQFCVLLIEDAEPLLASRSSDTRIQGVTNLLNMTDGLLNDMLKLQIICTFNVNLKKLDKALLRPGRLLARKEFKALPQLEANILASRLGVKHTFTKAATIAEIYSYTKNKDTLIHGVDDAN